MADEKIIEIKVKSNLDETTKSVEKLDNSVQDLNKTTKKAANTKVDEIGKGAEKSKKGIKSLSNGFKGLGLAIKATGIGLLVTLLGSLAAAFSENEKISKPFKIIMESISIVVNDLVNALSDAINKANEATGGFDALGKVIGGLLTIAVNQLKISFLGIKLAIQSAQVIWEKSFFGGNDKEKIKELNESILETKKAIVSTSESTAKAGKVIIDNFGEAVDEIGTLTESTIKEVSKVEISSARARAKTNIDLARSAQIAAAQQSLLVEKYDTLAESARQLRDNDLKGIDEREKANNDLAIILDMQEKAMLKQADAILASAQAQVVKNNSTENQVALLEAQANKEGVLAQITGFRSEQETNRIALIKERQELEQSGSEAEEQRQLRAKQFEAEREENELKRLEQLKTILEEERLIEEERLQIKVDSYEKGTQARLDAENELKDRLQEIDQQITLNADEQSKKRVENEKIEADTKTAIQNAQLNNLQSGVAVLKQVFEKNKELQAGLLIAESAAGIAKTIINTQVGNVKTQAQLGVIPAIPVVAANNVASGISIAATLAATAKGLSALGASGGSSAGSTGGETSNVSTQQAPAFNLVGASGVNQVQQSLQEEQQPIQAYVVGQNITTQQQIERNQVESASIG